MRKVSLDEIAQQAMLERGFFIEFPEQVIDELSRMSEPPLSQENFSFHDMRDCLWVSIDNDDSRDLDQLTFAKKEAAGKDTIYVAVADVDALVKRGSAIDSYAAHNTTSVYTPTKVFPMLPLKLSTDLTSLNEQVDRYAIVIEMEIDSDGRYALCDIYAALVRNHAKLAYNGVAAWLEQKIPLSHPAVKVPGFLEQLELQDLLAQQIKKHRQSQGSLTFASREVQAVIVDEMAVELKEKVPNRADELIENFMIIANVSVTEYLAKHNLPTLRRIVRVPKRWDRIVALAKALGEKLPSQPDVKTLRDFLSKQQQVNPQGFPDLSLAVIKLIGRGEYVLGLPGEAAPGHFDLALRDYAHTTAPNRRFPDLVMQRLLKSCLNKMPVVYDDKELSSIATQCTQKEDDAVKVERRVHKSAAAMVLSTKIGHEFSAVVTGINEDGTWVRLRTLPVEGKLVRGFQNLDVGDRLSVALVHVDILHGHIDFSRI